METHQCKEWPGDPIKGLAQSLTELWIIPSEPCAALCLQPTHSLTFFCCGFDTADQFNIVPWEKKKKRLLKFHPQMRCVSPAVIRKINLLALG